MILEHQHDHVTDLMQRLVTGGQMREGAAVRTADGRQFGDRDTGPGGEPGGARCDRGAGAGLRSSSQQ